MMRFILGVPMDLSLWHGVFAPAGTAPAIVEQLAADYARWRPIVRQAGFKLD